MTSLNPLKKIGKTDQGEHRIASGLKGEEARKATLEMLEKSWNQ